MNEGSTSGGFDMETMGTGTEGDVQMKLKVEQQKMQMMNAVKKRILEQNGAQCRDSHVCTLDSQDDRPLLGHMPGIVVIG